MITPQKLIINETRNSLIINFIITAAITFATMPKMDYLPLVGGPESAGFGLLMASLIFPILASLLITKVIQGKIANGKLQIKPSMDYPKFLIPLPHSTFARGFVAALFFFLIAFIVIFSLNSIVGNKWSYTHSILLNIIYVELMTLALVPMIVLTSLRLTILNTSK